MANLGTLGQEITEHGLAFVQKKLAEIAGDPSNTKSAVSTLSSLPSVLHSLAHIIVANSADSRKMVVGKPN